MLDLCFCFVISIAVSLFQFSLRFFFSVSFIFQVCELFKMKFIVVVVFLVDWIFFIFCHFCLPTARDKLSENFICLRGRSDKINIRLNRSTTTNRKTLHRSLGNWPVEKGQGKMCISSNTVFIKRNTIYTENRLVCCCRRWVTFGISMRDEFSTSHHFANIDKVWWKKKMPIPVRW